MKQYRIYILLTIILFFVSARLEGQFTMDFGNINVKDLSNKPCKFDPGAGAEILSDVAKATVNYIGRFYVELERDVRIRIINSKGFDYGNVELPYSTENSITLYRASSFNLRNGEVVETQIPKKNFLREVNSRTKNFLRFSFPDLHEGTVIEYSYVERLENEAMMTLIPWEFQREIPIVKTSISLIYPGFFSYKSNITGNPLLVRSQFAQKEQYFAGVQSTIQSNTWYSMEVPSFKEEPYMKSLTENQTRISFELSNINFPGIVYEEISPTYKTLAKKLSGREDFGRAISSGLSLKSIVNSVTKGLNNDIDKVKAIRKYVMDKVFWNGSMDFTSTSTLKNALNKGKGSSADINMILLVMLRQAGLSADPVILSTRDNGTISQFYAMLQQFNYLVVYVTINGKGYFVDATDPLRPFDLLPFNCLNGQGRLIQGEDSRFIDVKNSENFSVSKKLDLNLEENGSISGDITIRNSGYSAYNARQAVKLRGEEQFADIMNEAYPEVELKDLKLLNLSLPDSDLVESAKIIIDQDGQFNGNSLLINPFFTFNLKTPFPVPDRKFPVDFGCPGMESFNVTFRIPGNYEITEMPSNELITLGNGDAEYSFSIQKNGNMVTATGSFKLNRISYLPQDYSSLRDFYSKVARSQSRLIFLKKSS